MKLSEALRFALGAVAAHRLRSFLTTLGIVIGIASVVLLTSLGEGTRRSILSEFAQFGTNLLAVHPGKVETTGIMGSVGGTIKKLTIEDAEACRRIPGIEKIVPLVVGSARVTAGERGRDVMIYGVTAEALDVWKLTMAQGSFLPGGDPRQAAPLAVLGPKLKHELLGGGNALGAVLHIGGRRFVNVGVLAPKGQFLGFDLDDTVYVPVASAQSLFNTRALAEFDVLFRQGMSPAGVKEGVRRIVLDRHGEEDFSVTTQTEMLDVLDRVLGIVSIAVGGLGAISLLVGGIGILTMMWISVGERTAEIGLAKALGATPPQIQRIFLLEAAALSFAGGLLGLAAATAISFALRFALPRVPFHTAPGFALGALAMSVAVGLSSGVLPARRAAALDPIEALRAE